MTTRRGSPRPTCSTRSRRWPSTRPHTRSARERRADENTRRETRRGRKTNRLTERSERIEPSRTDVEERAARHLVAIEQSKNRDRSESSPPRRRRRARVAVSSSPTPPVGKISTVEVRICEQQEKKTKMVRADPRVSRSGGPREMMSRAFQGSQTANRLDGRQNILPALTANRVPPCPLQGLRSGCAPRGFRAHPIRARRSLQHPSPHTYDTRLSQDGDHRCAAALRRVRLASRALRAAAPRPSPRAIGERDHLSRASARCASNETRPRRGRRSRSRLRPPRTR